LIHNSYCIRFQRRKQLLSYQIRPAWVILMFANYLSSARNLTIQNFPSSTFQL